MEISEPKSIVNIIGVNSLRLGRLHILYYQMFSIKFTLILIFCFIHSNDNLLYYISNVLSLSSNWWVTNTIRIAPVFKLFIKNNITILTVQKKD